MGEQYVTEKYVGEKSMGKKYVGEKESMWLKSLWVKSRWVKSLWVKGTWVKSMWVRSPPALPLYRGRDIKAGFSLTNIYLYLSFRPYIRPIKCTYCTVCIPMTIADIFLGKFAWSNSLQTSWSSFPLYFGRGQPSYKCVIKVHFVVARVPCTRAFCNRTPKRQRCTFWSVHVTRVFRDQLSL